MGSLLIFQSGGPTSVINSTLNGVIRRCKDRGIAVYGALYGIEGLIRHEVVDLTSLPYNRLCLLRQTPGTALGTSRKKITSDFPHWKEVEQTLIDLDVDYLLVNGGNDSMDTALRLHEHFVSWGLKVVGIPKTIDNDLLGTDFCPGYPSACRHVMNSVASIVLDGRSYSGGKVNLIEIQGREAGWLTAPASLIKGASAPDLVLLPEMKWEWEDLLNRIHDIYKEKGCAFIVLSEGVDFPHETFSGTDEFGHAMNEGVCFALASSLHERFSLPVRPIALSTLCRADPFLISKVDSDKAQWLGEAAVDAALSGECGIMVGLRRSGEKTLHFALEKTPLRIPADQERLFPQEWIQGYSITKEFGAYLLPLIKEGIEVKTDKEGLFLFTDLLGK